MLIAPYDKTKKTQIEKALFEIQSHFTLSFTIIRTEVIAIVWRLLPLVHCD